MSYRLLLVSPIPVVRDGAGYRTLDLWAVDLRGQVAATASLTLACPILEREPSAWQGSAPLPASVRVVDSTGLRQEDLGSVVAQADVVQVYAGASWRASRLCRDVVREAARRLVPSIVGVSSNRARTALMNASFHGTRAALAAGRALATYVGVRASCRWLTRHADGTFIVGDGLRPLVDPRCRSLHVGIASWLEASAVAAMRERFGPGRLTEPEPNLHRLCIASRLERMKGVHVGIDALGVLLVSGQAAGTTLTIFGAGPERERLAALARHRRVDDRVEFAGTLAYPSPFLDRLGEHGIVLLPNLNDEQPRLVFDAIGRGCLPLCPRTAPYRALGLPDELLYRVGDSHGMAQAVAALQANPDQVGDLRSGLLKLAERWTLEAMHAQRARWINAEILNRTDVAATAG